MARRWLIHFFQRHPADDADRMVPARMFLDAVFTKVRAEIQTVREAVATAPPPSFSGGGKWEVMRDDMAGFYEVRVKGADRKNHRLFCVRERDAADLGGPLDHCDRRTFETREDRCRASRLPPRTATSGRVPQAQDSVRHRLEVLGRHPPLLLLASRLGARLYSLRCRGGACARRLLADSPLRPRDHLESESIREREQRRRCRVR